MKKLILIGVFVFGYAQGYAGNVNKTEPAANEKIVATFKVTALHISKEGLINWTSVYENGSLPYVIEQFIFDKWACIGQVQGQGSSGANSYSYRVVFHNGINKFRIRQRGQDKVIKYSTEITYSSERTPLSYSLIHRNKTISFSGETFYQVYDPYGEVVAKGFGTSVDITNYRKGNYCLIYDNQISTFKKHRVLMRNSALPIVL